MRKLIIWTTSLVVLLLTVYVVLNGIGSLDIYGYRNLEKNDKLLNDKVAELQKVKEDDYKKAKLTLNEMYKKYTDVKNDYKTAIEAAKEAGANGSIQIENYDIDFLWTTLGNYATDLDLTLTLNILPGTKYEELQNSSEFKLWDLKFDVNGNYGDIVQFIYKIEGDERIGAKISDFVMSPQRPTSNPNDKDAVKEEPKVNNNNGTVYAQFTVKNVPISTKGFNDEEGRPSRPTNERLPFERRQTDEYERRPRR